MSAAERTPRRAKAAARETYPNRAQNVQPLPADRSLVRADLDWTECATVAVHFGHTALAAIAEPLAVGDDFHAVALHSGDKYSIIQSATNSVASKLRWQRTS